MSRVINWQQFIPKRKGKFPFSVWIAFVNAVRSQSLVEVKGGLLTQTSDGVLLEILHRPGGSSEQAYPFQIIQSPYTGSGTSPADQARRIKVLPGNVNNVMPSNINGEITVPANSGNYQVWLDCTLTYSNDGVASLEELTIDSGDTMPDNPSSDRPSKSYRQIGVVVTNENSVTAIYQALKTSLWLVSVLSNYDCTKRVMSVQWTGA